MGVSGWCRGADALVTVETYPRYELVDKAWRGMGDEYFGFCVRGC